MQCHIGSMTKSSFAIPIARSAAIAAAILLCAQAGIAQPPSAVTSILQTIATDHPAARPVPVYEANAYFEAPNWTRDGRSLLFDEAGSIMEIPVAGGQPVTISVGAASRCNGSHGLSPDGKLLAITCNMAGLKSAHVFLVPLGGGEPKQLTHTDGSYWHSWSPDGKTILFTHPENGSLNVFSVAVDGSDEHAITSGSGVSDDPDFSPDGKYIYFCSDRNGTMQIWRMHPDGSSPEQVTFDDRVNWTPHVSPDGRQMVYISYEKGTTGHPANRAIVLRLMSMKDRSTRDLVSLTGGSGTMNVPSWAPDSRYLAFVGYRVAEQQPSESLAKHPVR
jgi:TolB protein